MKIKPHILIVDNEPDEVESIKLSLSKAGFEPTVVTSTAEADLSIGSTYHAFILLDVALGKDGSDTQGLDYGLKCVTKVPGSVRLCTSARDLPRYFAPEMIEALNPAPETLKQAFFAFGTKVDDFENPMNAERVDHYVKKYRSQLVGNGDRCEFEVSDEALAEEIRENFKAIKWHARDARGEFFEILKRLAYRPPLPAPSRIELTKMGKGRSNTIVCLAKLTFPAHPDEPGLPPYRTIIKIGRAESVGVEAENYGRYAWRFLRPELYPKLEGSVALNDLGGLAYSLVEDGTSQARTLTDLIMDPECPLADALELANRALDERTVDKITDGPHNLLSTLVTRFHRLGTKTKMEEAMKRLEAQWSETGETLTEHQRRVTSRSGVSFTVQLDADLSIDGAIRFEAAQVALQHGDFHGDNILCTQNLARAWNLSFIDFANSGEQPCALDHVILEVAIRYQFLRYVAAHGLVEKLQELGGFSSGFEVDALTAFFEERKDISGSATNPEPVAAVLDRLGSFVSAVRRNFARRYFKGVGSGGGGFREEAAPLAMLYQYLGTLSIAALSGMNLPMPDSVRDHSARWLAHCSGLAFASHNQLKRLKVPRSANPSERALWKPLFHGLA